MLMFRAYRMTMWLLSLIDVAATAVRTNTSTSFREYGATWNG
jgi:hypothetical protein